MLLRGSLDNLKLFYTSFLPDKACGAFSFDEAIPFGARLLSILLQDDSSAEKQLLKEHLRALYNNYSSIYLISKRTIQDGENDCMPDTFDKAFDKAFDKGSLNCNEFNELIKVLISNYMEYSFYYELQTDKIIVSFPRQKISERYKEKTFLVQEENNRVYLIFGRTKNKIPKIHTINELLKAKGCTRAISISNKIKDIVKDFQINEPCCWCNPVEKTKHKCECCKKLENDYKLLLNKCTFLAKDLNQIIKRVQKQYYNYKIEELREAIKNKINTYIISICKKNNSTTPNEFINNLEEWYKNL